MFCGSSVTIQAQFPHRPVGGGWVEGEISLHRRDCSTESIAHLLFKGSAIIGKIDFPVKPSRLNSLGNRTIQGSRGVFARSVSDEAISSPGDCFAFARNDGEAIPWARPCT